MTKPSTWDRETVWRESARAHFRMLAAGGVAVPTWVKTLDFPPDPVERVSDETVSVLADGRPVVMQRNAIQLMAIELIERRAKDKGEKA